MRITRGTFWPVYKQLCVMHVPTGAKEHLCNEVECENCRTLYQVDTTEEPRTPEQFPHAQRLIDAVQKGTLNDAERTNVLASMIYDLRYMTWHNANYGRTESINAVAAIILLVLLVATSITWHNYFDPRGSSSSTLAVAIALTLATVAMFLWLGLRVVRRNQHALKAGTLDRMLVAVSHLRPTEATVRNALVQVAEMDAAYAGELHDARFIERIMNPSDTLRP